MSYKSKFKNYGLGLGLRRDLKETILKEIQEEQNDFSWLEIVPENFIYLGAKKQFDFQEILATQLPVIPHGVNLSIGTASKEVNKDFYLLDGLKELFQEIKPPWFSDHLSCTRINGHYLQELIPLPFNQEMVNIVVDNIKFLQDYLQLDFLVENPSYYMKYESNTLTELEFINSVVDKANAGILLDVNNIFVNLTNHNDYQYQDFINNLDLSRVVQVHIAGHAENYFTWLAQKQLKILDTHAAQIRQEVLDIFAYLLSQTSINAVLLERDSNFADFAQLKIEMQALKQIMQQGALV